MAKSKPDKKKSEKRRMEEFFLEVFSREKGGESARSIISSESERHKYLRWKKKNSLIQSNKAVRDINSRQDSPIVVNNHFHSSKIDDFDFDDLLKKMDSLPDPDPKALEKLVYYTAVERISRGDTKALDIGFKVLTRISNLYKDTKSKANPQDFTDIWKKVLDQKNKNKGKDNASDNTSSNSKVS